MPSKRLARYCLGLLVDGRSCPAIVPAGGGSYCVECKQRRAVVGSINRPKQTTKERGYDSYYKRQRLRVLARDGYVCQLRLPGCTYKADTVDHQVPLAESNGRRRYRDDELVAACGHCNFSRGGSLGNKRKIAGASI